MKIPTSAPVQVQIDGEGDGARLTLHVERPWWRFWIPTKVSVVLTRHEVIWLYQASYKHMVKQEAP